MCGVGWEGEVFWGKSVYVVIRAYRVCGCPVISTFLRTGKLLVDSKALDRTGMKDAIFSHLVTAS
jgi:hypothetical protein